ncbi:hypothetical protein GGS23DRAFT_575291 [Durotheca rogersii]|uniref:uncharacterized protein n=1 Tax=Durotheca rogersii TaxID=419775 RepID=UPI002221020F|nr:uncharacterized protein GGS23DRAFT_575291 [Durotheca rogersii]KAI5861864.1 hypothetical protein GGS23DRAFT_575291 [Durotheca rogersii]
MQLLFSFFPFLAEFLFDVTHLQFAILPLSHLFSVAYYAYTPRPLSAVDLGNWAAKKSSSMSKNNAVVNDTSLPLGQIRNRNRSSIVSSVLAIQKYVAPRENRLKSLECLSLVNDFEEPSGKRRRVANGSVASHSCKYLRRTPLNPVGRRDEREYIAVSYTWNPSKAEEQKEDGGYGEAGVRYFVESRRSSGPPLPSRVRDVVWDRVLNYSECVGCEKIWIDRECIDQEDEAEKEAAIQNMHLVYHLSDFPIALLTHRVDTDRDLDLLVDLMFHVVDAEDKPAVLKLLEDITSDLWWTRAWTFQEDYKASVRMEFLLPHSPDLELRKKTMQSKSGDPLLGNISGEICIKSTDFRRQATEFCLSLRERPEYSDACDKILQAAAKYDILLRDEFPQMGTYASSRSMSPMILANIGARGITVESDRLAIAANCTGYTTRLDARALNRDGCSLSLSILALYLLNGEIMENNPKHTDLGSTTDNIFEYISKQSLGTFQSPVSQSLTFIKSCRFVEPGMTPEGIRTRGHLWKLGRIIRPGPMTRVKYRTLSLLDELATNLQFGKYGVGCGELAHLLCQWLYERPMSQGDGPRAWQGWMMDEVEKALKEGKALRLGHFAHPADGIGDNPRAIFIDSDRSDWDDDDDGEPAPSYAFTSMWFARGDQLDSLNKHVSLEVEADWPVAEGRLPRLYTKRWLNGICFFQGCPLRPVVFPWPSALLE